MQRKESENEAFKKTTLINNNSYVTRIERNANFPPGGKEHQNNEEKKNTNLEIKSNVRLSKVKKVMKWFSKTLKGLDGYGNQVDDPGFRKQTTVGALLSITFKLLFLICVIVVIFKVIISETSVSSGNTIILNPRTGESTATDFPNLEFHVQNKLIFFENSKINVQRISVEDMSGLPETKSYTNIDPNTRLKSDGDPKTFAVYKERTIPLNTFSDTFTIIKNDESGKVGEFDFMNLYDEKLSHKYLGESLRSIKILQEGSAVYDKFYSHTVSAFVRLKKEEISKIKSNMMQLNLVNKGELEVLISRLSNLGGLQNVSNHFRLTSLVSDEKLWSKESFDSDGKLADNVKNINTFILKSDYNQEAIETFITTNLDILDSSHQTELRDNTNSAFNNWILYVSYVNNFKNIVEDNFGLCAEHSDHWEMKKGLAFSNLTDSQNSILQFPPSDALFTQSGEYCSSSPPSLPFYVSLMGLQGQEIVKVNNIHGNCQNGMIWNIERSNIASQRINFASQRPLPSTFSSIPPAEWTCSPNLYNRHDSPSHICTCNCQSYDPSCLLTGGVSTSCGDNQKCSEFGICVDKDLSWLTEDGKYVAVSELCRNILPQNTEYFLGTIGGSDTLNFASHEFHVCPFEDNFDYKPQQDPKDLKFYCNMKVSSEIDPFTMNIDSIYNLDDPDFVHFNTTIFRGSGFPLKTYSSTGEETTVLVDQDSMILEESKLMGTDTNQKKIQSLKLSSTQGVDTILEKISIGKILLSISKKSKTIGIVISSKTYPPAFGSSEDKEVYFKFPTTNYPYLLTTQNGRRLKVVDSSIHHVPSFHTKIQFFTLNDYPTFNYGFRIKLKSDIFANSNSFNLTFDPTIDTFDSSALGATPFSLIIQSDDVRSIEIVEVTSVTQHVNWNIMDEDNCGIEAYGANDGVCNCGCGSYDPDCADLSPKEFSDNGGEVVGCNATHPYCSYPSGKCSSTAPTSTTTVTPTPLVFEFHLSAPVMFNHATGEFVHYSGFFNDPLQVRRIVDIELSKTSKEKPFKPSERYKNQVNEDFESPPQLDVEVAMFISPSTIQLGDLGVTFCPSFETNNTTPAKTTFENWKLYDSKHLNIQCASSHETFDLSSKCKSIEEIEVQDLGITCATESEQSYSFDFNVSIPITHRFEKALDSNEDSEQSDVVFESESKFDFSETFSFHYDDETEEVEKLFSKKKGLGGDLTNINGERRRFFGSLYYRGFGKSNDGQYNTSVPASSPYLFTRVKLKVADDALENFQQFESWPLIFDRDAYNRIIESFEETFIDFTFNEDYKSESTEMKRILLEPGYQYTVSANVQINPYYRVNEPWAHIADIFPMNLISDKYLSANVLDKFRVSIVSKSVTKEKLTSDQFNCVIKYQLEVDGKASQFVEKKEYTVSSMLSDIGSSLALTGIGLIILKYWQLCFQKNVAFVDMQEKNEELKRKRIKKRFRNQVGSVLQQKKIQKKTVVEKM